jgi:quercetin dioxygenase-like cupin family protein
MRPNWKAVVLGAIAAVVASAARAGDSSAATAGAGQHAVKNAKELKWGPPPAGLPPGAEATVVQGDPSAEGKPFTVRLRMPKGYTIAPHSHPTDENVTVLSGRLLVGEGDRIDKRHAKALSAGGFAAIPKEHHHYAVANASGTVVQVHAIGPFAITYVNAEDDPRKNVAAGKQQPSRAGRTPKGR